MKRSPLMIYLPTEVKEVLKKEAEKRGMMKMSRFVLNLICKELGMEKKPERYIQKEVV